jgi:altronate dehydratase
MPIFVDWGDQNKTYIHYQLTDPWTWEDYYVAAREWRELVDAVHHPVITVLDFRGAAKLPGNAMTHLKQAAMSAHPNFGGLIIVGVNTFIRLIVNMMMRIYPNSAQRVYVAATLEEARAHLAHIRAEQQAVNLRQP